MPDRAVFVIGIGNEWRGDDGAGIAVVRRLRASVCMASIAVHEHRGELIGLLDLWAGRDVVVVDAIVSGAPVGALRRLDLAREPLGACASCPSTHAVGLEDALELGRVLDRLPERLVLVAVEGRSFGVGSGLSPAVERAVPLLAGAVLDEARRLSARTSASS